VLLIACANVANLQLARAAARRGQTALRLAIGASRGQIIVQALTESVLLAVGGGVAGLLVAMAAARLLLDLAFQSAHFLPIQTTPSLVVLAFAFVLALITGMIFGAAPAWFATRTDPAEALRGSGRATRDRSTVARKALLIVQATLSVVLVAGATMLARSLSNLENQDFGYQISGRVIVTLHNPPADYPLPKLSALYRQMEENLNRLPGVQGVGLALYNPLTDNWGEGVFILGHPTPGVNESTGSSWDRVSANYLQNFGIPVLRGRAFTVSDNETTAPVAIANEAFVKRFFKSKENPLDQHFGLDMLRNAGTYRIVGVVRDAKFAGFNLSRPAQPMFYVPLAQNVEYPPDDVMKRVEVQSHFISGIMLVTNIPPGALEPVLTKTLADLDPNLTITTVRTMRQMVDLSFDQERAVAGLAGLFGIVALILAVIGLYGVTAYTVAQRTNEIGIRMALGANRGGIASLIARQSLPVAIIGIVCGLGAAAALARLMRGMLYQIDPADPATFASVGALVLIVATLAALVPARRAMRVDPMIALRHE
jgi:predicted permease